MRKVFGIEIAKAFEIICKYPEYTAQQMAQELDKTPKTVEKYLAKLKDAGIIKRIGPKLGGYWERV
ncbi:MAG: ArsR family transcriptional regulator [Candidatus Kapabacteria bacterium]|nr:ArsR family transcriptional regulator [Candidatus Kapabacteria bacterium]